jgi:hypothetical protein
VRDVQWTASTRHSTARQYCGRRINRRSIFAYVFYPHALGASTSFEKLLIARFPGNRYRVWFQIH